MNEVPHLGVPLRFTGNRYAANQQGTTDEISACVAVVCSFARGSREEAPEFGITDPSFQQRPVDITDVQQACEEYEPRAIVRVSEQAYDPRDPLASTVTVAVSVLQTEDT
jgi:hypothetical protein